MKYFVSIIIFLISACSVYKSEGRKKFETDTPVRVANLVSLSCGPVSTEQTHKSNEAPIESFTSETISGSMTSKIYIYKYSLNDQDLIETDTSNKIYIQRLNNDSNCISTPISEDDFLAFKTDLIRYVLDWP